MWQPFSKVTRTYEYDSVVCQPLGLPQREALFSWQVAWSSLRSRCDVNRFPPRPAVMTAITEQRLLRSMWPRPWNKHNDYSMRSISEVKWRYNEHSLVGGVGQQTLLGSYQLVPHTPRCWWPWVLHATTTGGRLTNSNSVTFLHLHPPLLGWDSMAMQLSLSHPCFYKWPFTHVSIMNPDKLTGSPRCAWRKLSFGLLVLNGRWIDVSLHLPRKSHITGTMG